MYEFSDLMRLLRVQNATESTYDADVLLGNHSNGGLGDIEPDDFFHDRSNRRIDSRDDNRDRLDNRGVNSYERGGHGYSGKRHEDRSVRRGNRGNRSRSPRDDTDRTRERRRPLNAFPPKAKEDKTGNLSSTDSQTNAAVRIVLGHWLDTHYDGYQQGPAPTNWNIHPTVLKKYRQSFPLPVTPQKVFDLAKDGQSTAGYLHRTWRQPKEAVHAFWRRYGAVAAPDVDFFLQAIEEEDKTPESTSNLVPQWTANLPAAVAPAVAAQMQPDDSTVEDREDDPEYQPRFSNRDEIQDSEDPDEDDEDDEDEKSTLAVAIQKARMALADGVGAPHQGQTNKSANIDKNDLSAVCRGLGLPINSMRQLIKRPELARNLMSWATNESKNPGIYDNLYTRQEVEVPSLLMICSRTSNRNASTYQQAVDMREQLFPDTMNLILTVLMPGLKPAKVVNMIAYGYNALRNWCFSSSSDHRLRSKMESQADPEHGRLGKDGWSHCTVQFMDAFYELKAMPGQGHTAYIAMHGNEGWGIKISEWEKLPIKFPGVKIVLIFGLRARNMNFDRTGWSPFLRERYWGFFDLHKLLRVYRAEEVDPMYRFMIDDLAGDVQDRETSLRKSGRNKVPAKR